MTILTKLFDDYEKALLEQGEVNARVKLLELQIRVSQPTDHLSVEASPLDNFIQRNSTWLTNEQLAFLNVVECSPIQAATQIGKSESTVKRMCQRGELAYRLEGGRYRVFALAVMRWVEKASNLRDSQFKSIQF